MRKYIVQIHHYIVKHERRHEVMVVVVIYVYDSLRLRIFVFKTSTALSAGRS